MQDNSANEKQSSNNTFWNDFKCYCLIKIVLVAINIVLLESLNILLYYLK